ncbi:hypothetical protein BZA05DRAFT_394569, partial [Tricharina praecox]|uniref:uncharacterized protein n=1 Tax=Tricharina praecox TaxID=43433 RepID=UPI00221F7400
MSGRSHRDYADISQQDVSTDSEAEAHELNPMAPPEKPSESRRHKHHRRERERERRGDRQASPAAADRVDSGLLRRNPSRPRHSGRAHGAPGRESEDPGYRAANKDFQRSYGRRGGEAPPAWTRTPTFREDGTGELQTYYQSMGPTAQGQLARRHDYRKQYAHLMGKILLRWLASFILAAAMVVAFYQYEKIKILSKSKKRWFNAVTTGLYLTLGLNLAASLKGMAIIVRWKLLARKAHQLEEVDFLLGLSSLIKVFRYGIHIFRTRPMTSMACFSWILFNAVGRLSVALTGLTYSYDSAGAAFLQHGTVNVTNWATFSEHDAVSRSYTPTAESERASAHQWGLFSVIFQYQQLTKPGVSDPNTPYDRPIEIASDDEGWVYYFRERNPHVTTTHTPLAVKSGRWIQSSAECDYYPLIEGQYGNSSTVVYLNGTEEHTLSGISDYGPAATTWINPRSDLPRNNDWDCGSRCASVAALSFLGPTDSGNGAFYDCEVSISTVQNGTEAIHQMPDSVAHVAAGAISLEGYSTGPDSWEYVRYIPESPWSNYGTSLSTDADYMARLASRFAIGAIAAKDFYGESTAQAKGQLVVTGVLLKVKWNFLFLILGTILVCQLLLGCATVAYANTVFCKDDSYLSTARLLRPIVERLGPSGCAMTGKDIAHTLSENMVYGVRADEGGTRHHLDLGEDIVPRKWFPEGWYDGYEEWVDAEEENVDLREKQKKAARRRPVVLAGAATSVRRRRAW